MARRVTLASGGSKGGRSSHTDQNFLHFMQFFNKSGKFVYWRPPPGGLAPPPTGNPGSAPVSGCFRHFPPKCFEMAGPMNAILSFFDCRFIGGDTQRWWGHLNPTCCNKECELFLHSEVVGTQNILLTPLCQLTPAHTRATR